MSGAAFYELARGAQRPRPVIEPLTRATATGFQLEAQVGALAARSLWLALIAPDGAVYDLTGQSHKQPDGSVGLGASIDLPKPQAPGAGDYLLLAVTSSQPLVAVAAAPAGASAETLLPAVLSELQADPDAAAAALAPLVLQSPPPQTVPDDAG